MLIFDFKILMMMFRIGCVEGHLWRLGFVGATRGLFTLSCLEGRLFQLLEFVRFVLAVIELMIKKWPNSYEQLIQHPMKIHHVSMAYFPQD